MAPPRTLHIRCASWAQVEAFYSRKLRRGRLLSMRVPFAPPIGAELTVGLELPTHMVLTIDGVVRKCEPSDAEARHWIEIELVGLSDELLTGLRDMVADSSKGEPAEVAPPAAEPPRPRGAQTVAPPASPAARPAPASFPLPSVLPSVAPAVMPSSTPSSTPSAAAAGRAAASASASPVASPAEVQPEDERELFAVLSAELRRLRLAAVHEVLGVSRDARAEEIRDGWMAHIRRYHPDVMARHRSLAVSHLAEELTILGNRAYDRLRVALVAEGRGAAFGPALFTPHGWLVGFEDLATSDVPAARALAMRSTSGPTPVTTTLPPVVGMAGGASSESGFEPVSSTMAARTVESYEAAARELLAAGDSSSAREILAAALVAYPRSRPLRSLYYVASALTALAAGQLVLATSQLETALAHHEGCVEASLVLEQIHRNGATDYEALRKVFQ